MKVDDVIVEKIRKFVEEECRKPSSKYGFDIYEAHFVPMAENSKILAKKLNADTEIVELAAWLHDIGSIIYGRENHHITGTEVAEKKLRELGYPEVKIEKVKKCILNHRGFVNNLKGSAEEQIIADADGMAAFDRIEGLFKAALIYENLSQQEARISVKKKLVNCFNKLSLDAQGIIKDKYEAAMLLFK